MVPVCGTCFEVVAVVFGEVFFLFLLLFLFLCVGFGFGCGFFEGVEGGAWAPDFFVERVLGGVCYCCGGGGGGGCMLWVTGLGC